MDHNSPSIKVLVVDDSAVVRRVMSELLDDVPDINLIATASDPIFALQKLESITPDVIVLDLEMPRMDGLTFLEKIMSENPIPVVICSTLTGKGADASLKAMSLGAVEVITKPKIGLKSFLQDERAMLINSIRAAAVSRVGKKKPVTRSAPSKIQDKAANIVNDNVQTNILRSTTDLIIAMGTSTGGTQALEQVLPSLPITVPGIVIVQHMPEKFTKAFADRLNGLCEITVKEAEDGDRVVPGQALIAPGGLHMKLVRSGAQYRVQVKDGPLVNRHKPSVDILFRSAAGSAGPNALGVIMTGMGDDGASGLRDMRNAGAQTIAQDEASCIVYGMPNEAVKQGGVEKSVSLQEIAGELIKFGAGKRI